MQMFFSLMLIFKSTFALLFYLEGCILLNENNSYFEIQKEELQEQ